MLYPLEMPNGVALSDDGTRLYATETRTRRVWEFSLAPGGVIERARGFATVPSGGPMNFGGADGICVDGGGRVVVATLGMGGVTVYSPEGEQLGALMLDDPMTTNAAYDDRVGLPVRDARDSGTGGRHRRLAARCHRPVIAGRHQPGTYARERPDAPAVILAGTGERLTWRELDTQSNRIAHRCRALGLRAGDTVALLIENHLRAFEVTWAVLRSGLRYTFVNSMLTSDEVAEILNASGAQVLVTSTRRLAAAVDATATTPVPYRFVLASHGDQPLAALPAGWEWLDDAIDSMPSTPVADEREGAPLWFSSGTSGRPKGVLRDVPDLPAGHPDEQSLAYAAKYGFGPYTVHLALGPLHHAAPIGFSTMVQRFGGTVVLTERFDAEAALGDIERYRVTFSHIVPTMFVRFLKLPRRRASAVRRQLARARAPWRRPVPPRRQAPMIEWWGPILDEYYAGTEGVGATSITSEEWLAHPGSVGRSARGTIHITDEDGHEVPPGVEGMVWFDSPVKAVYRGDPEQTAAITHPEGWQTLGDVGYLDDDGYLFLTDRWTHKIVTGGVNVFPREVEDVLLAHPKVLDVAVIGVPDDEMGESVRAVVEPVSWDDVSDPSSPTNWSRGPARDSRTTSAPAPSTSNGASPAARTASSTSASSATATGRGRTSRIL